MSLKEFSENVVGNFSNSTFYDEKIFSVRIFFLPRELDISEKDTVEDSSSISSGTTILLRILKQFSVVVVSIHNVIE